MTLANRLRWTALASVLVGCGFVACSSVSSTSTDDGTPTAPPPAQAPEGAGVSAPTTSPVALAEHPRLITTQSSRIFNATRAAEKAAQRAALEETRLHPELADGGPPPNWVLKTTAPVLGSVAIYGASFTSSSSADRMFFGTNGSSTGTLSSGFTQSSPATTITGNNFFAFNNLHAATPTILWAANVGGGLTASVGLSADGSRVLALGDNGTLYCFVASSGATCPSPWVSNPSLTITGAGITPWIEYGQNAIYVANGAGGIYRINLTTGTKQWGGNAYSFSSSASRGWPLEANNIIYIGDGSGIFYRIQDPTTGTADSNNMTPPSSQTSVALSGSACGGTVSVDSSASLDTTANLVFLSYNGCGVSFPHYCATGGCTNTTGTWGITKSATSASTPAATQQTWPALDGSYLYWVVAGKPGGSTPTSALWKAPYALTSVRGSNLVNSSTGASLGSSPIVYNGLAYVGDQSGQVEEFGCASNASATTAFVAETSVTGATVGTPIEFDDATGNIEYGFSNGSSAGGVAQFPLTTTDNASNYKWYCPSGMVACDHQVCGAGTSKTSCVPTAACTSGSCTVAGSGSTSIQYGYAAENGTISPGDGGTALCPTGTVIQGIIGADYGTPPSSDSTISGTFAYSTTCSATDSLAVIEGACQQTPAVNSCTVKANNATFGDTCVGTVKSFYGWFVCGPASDAGTTPIFCSRQNLTPSSGSDPCNGTSCAGTCTSGWADCDSNLQYDGCEVNISSDVGNCGACGNVCTNANGSTTCTSSVCVPTCNSGYADCDGNAANGCESATATDVNNCGGCGIRCAGTSPSCVSGVCAAPTGPCSTVASVSGAGIYAIEAASEGATTTGQQASSNVCPAGTVLQQFVGASYGTPPSSDLPSGTAAVSNSAVFATVDTTITACSALNSLTVTNAKCPVDTSLTCSFSASNTTFGDPCVGTGKHYYGWAVCAPASDAGSVPYYCSRQNVTPTGTEMCNAGTCQGTCKTGFSDCNGNLQSDGCENYTNGGPCPTIAYADAKVAGSQSWTGSLGMDFTVNSSAKIEQIGAFDSGQDGLNSSITVAIWTNPQDGGTPTVVSGTQQTLSGTAQPLSGGDRFYTLTTPVTLAPGYYSVVAYGYGASEMNGNAGVGTWTTNTESTGSGKITFTGTGRYSSSTGTFPTTVDTGPSNRYGAGTFVFQ